MATLVTRGLGLGALVTAGLGLGSGSPPIPPAPPVPIVEPAEGGGGPSLLVDPVGPHEYLHEDGTGWPDRLARQARRWARVQAGLTRGEDVLVSGMNDAGHEVDTWDQQLRTAGGTDAGKRHETWEGSDTFSTAGGTDAGKKHEGWS